MTEALEKQEGLIAFLGAGNLCLRNDDASKVRPKAEPAEK